MSDEIQQSAAPEAAPAEGTRPAPRPGAAAAARRARRIGGRAVATGREDPAQAAAPAAPRGSTAAAADEASAEPAYGTSADVPPRVVFAVPTWLRWLPAGVLTAAALTMVVLLVVFSHGVWWAKPSTSSIRDRVLAGAKTCMTAINTYNYADLDAYQRKALACTTGALTSDLRQAIQSIVRVKAPQLKASQTIKVHDVGIESVSGNHWTVLVFAQVDLKSTTYPKGSQTPYSAEVEMQQVGGKWLLSRETTLGGSASTTGSGASGAPPAPTAGPTSGSASGSPSPTASSSGH